MLLVEQGLLRQTDFFNERHCKNFQKTQFQTQPRRSFRKPSRSRGNLRANDRIVDD